MAAKKTAKVVQNQARQGDVFVMRIQSLPANAMPKPSDPRGVVLAEGEVTGHHHRIKKSGVCLLRADGVAYDLMTIADGIIGRLVHEEHSEIPFAAGVFEVRVQREHSWNAEAEEVSRAVQD
jgi:hypothetical protein